MATFLAYGPSATRKPSLSSRPPMVSASPPRQVGTLTCINVSPALEESRPNSRAAGCPEQLTVASHTERSCSCAVLHTTPPSGLRSAKFLNLCSANLRRVSRPVEALIPLNIDARVTRRSTTLRSPKNRNSRYRAACAQTWLLGSIWLDLRCSVATDALRQADHMRLTEGCGA